MPQALAYLRKVWSEGVDPVCLYEIQYEQEQVVKLPYEKLPQFG